MTRSAPVTMSAAMSVVGPGVPLPEVSRWKTTVRLSGHQVGR